MPSLLPACCFFTALLLPSCSECTHISLWQFTAQCTLQSSVLLYAPLLPSPSFPAAGCGAGCLPWQHTHYHRCDSHPRRGDAAHPPSPQPGVALGAWLCNMHTITDATLSSAPLLPPCCLPPSPQPGVALGAYLGNTRIITDAMLTHAAEMLPTLISDEDLEKGKSCSYNCCHIAALE